MISYHTNPFAALGGKQTGGMNVYVRQLSRSLARLGHSIDVFIGSNNKNIEIVEIEACVQLLKIPVKQLNTSFLATSEKAIFHFSSEVIKYSKSNLPAYDLVHAHYWLSGIAAIELSRKWGIPSLLMMHTLGLMKERLQLISKNDARIRIRGERKAIAHVNKIIAATIAEQAELQWLYEVAKEKIIVLSPGVDLALFKPIQMEVARKRINMPLNEKLLLFVGRIDAIKGLETLFSALKMLQETGSLSQLRLNIIGGEKDHDGHFSNSEINRLFRLAKKLNISDHIHFLGSKEQEELPAYYNAADIVILPSHYESFGLVALEAMACARPVLATRVGGLAHLVKHNESGLLSPPNDPEAMAENILALLNDEAWANQLGARGLLMAQTKSWEAIARQIEKVYEGLL